MAGRGGLFVFSRRDGAGFFFSEAGRGVFFCFFDGTGRGVFFFFEGRDGTVVLAVGFFLAGRGTIVTPSRQPSM